MKKTVVFAVAIVMLSVFVGCSNSNASNDKSKETAPVDSNQETTTNEEESASVAKEIDSLQPGDEVDVVGQKANSTLVNENTIWVQTVGKEKTIVYHCQLKDEFISDAEKMSLLDVVSIKGLFLNTVESQDESTAMIVTLYDCELLD